MTYEEIQKASKSIKTTDIRGKQYAEVNQRIKAFRMLCPNGCITTEILANEDGIVVMKASVKDEEGKLLGTGTAYEKEGNGFINKSSYIENTETSAVGRALGFAGFGSDGSIASYEEVMNAQKQQHKMNEDELKAELKQLLEDTGSDVTKFIEWCVKTFERKDITCVDDLQDIELKHAIKTAKDNKKGDKK